MGKTQKQAGKTVAKGLGRLRKRMATDGWFILVGLVPILLIYAYLRIIPIGKSVYMSFFNWNYVTNNNIFIGLTNYENMFQSE